MLLLRFFALPARLPSVSPSNSHVLRPLARTAHFFLAMLPLTCLHLPPVPRTLSLPIMFLCQPTTSAPSSNSSRPQRVLSMSSAYPQFKSKTASLSSAPPRVVSLPVFFFSPRSQWRNRLDTLVYAPQGPWRWLLWHRMALRLARNPASEYPTFAYAMWGWRARRMGW